VRLSDESQLFPWKFP